MDVISDVKKTCAGDMRVCVNFNRGENHMSKVGVFTHV